MRDRAPTRLASPRTQCTCAHARRCKNVSATTHSQGSRAIISFEEGCAQGPIHNLEGILFYFVIGGHAFLVMHNGLCSQAWWLCHKLCAWQRSIASLAIQDIIGCLHICKTMHMAGICVFLAASSGSLHWESSMGPA